MVRVFLSELEFYTNDPHSLQCFFFLRIYQAQWKCQLVGCVKRRSAVNMKSGKDRMRSARAIKLNKFINEFYFNAKFFLFYKL